MQDLISRQAVIDALWKALCEYEDKTEKQFQESDELDVGDWILHRIFVQNMSDIDRRTILELPPAHPERKTGHWILYDKRFPWSKDYKCSECGNYINISDINAGRGSANFCPNCGADMREVKVKCGDEDTLQGGLMSAT